VLPLPWRQPRGKSKELVEVVEGPSQKGKHVPSLDGIYTSSIFSPFFSSLVPVGLRSSSCHTYNDVSGWEGRGFLVFNYFESYKDQAALYLLVVVGERKFSVSFLLVIDVFVLIEWLKRWFGKALGIFLVVVKSFFWTLFLTFGETGRWWGVWGKVDINNDGMR